MIEILSGSDLYRRFISHSPYDRLKGRGASHAGSALLRWCNALVVAQVMFSVVLLVGAGLLLKSFAHLGGVHLGFATDRTLAMKAILPLQGLTGC